MHNIMNYKVFYKSGTSLEVDNNFDSNDELYIEIVDEIGNDKHSIFLDRKQIDALTEHLLYALQNQKS